MKKESGTTLLEMLVCLLLGAALLLCALVLLRTANSAYLSLLIAQRRTLALSVTHEQFKRAMLNLDSLPFHFAPRLHLPGRLRYADGSDNPVQRGAKQHRPHPESAALTTLRLETQAALSVIAHQWSGPTISIDACPRFDTANLELATYHSYLAQSLEQTFELVPLTLPTHHPSRPHCYRFRLQAQKSMLTINTTTSEIPLVLIPIQEIYTLYVDNERTLRYLSHAGGQNIENQPILEQAPILGIEWSTPQVNQPDTLNVKLHFLTGHEENFRVQTLLAHRQGPFNFLLNF